MARHLIFHPESDCLFETFDDAEADQAVLFGLCDVVTGVAQFERQFKKEQSMAKEVTIKKTFTRDELVGVMPRTGKLAEYSPVNSGNYLTARLLEAGVPVIGAFGILAVEWGTMTIKHEDGLDGDEWEITWVGEKLPSGWPKRNRVANCMEKLSMDKPLKQLIADEDEL
jgi:hypothetical protein